MAPLQSDMVPLVDHESWVIWHPSWVENHHSYSHTMEWYAISNCKCNSPAEGYIICWSAPMVLGCMSRMLSITSAQIVHSLQCTGHRTFSITQCIAVDSKYTDIFIQFDILGISL
jgi:hypothetical protein